MPKTAKIVEEIGLGNMGEAPGLSPSKAKVTEVESIPGLTPEKKSLKKPLGTYKSKGLGDVEEAPGLSFGKRTADRKLGETELVRVTKPGYRL